MCLCVSIQCMLQWRLCNSVLCFSFFFRHPAYMVAKKMRRKEKGNGNKGAFEHFWLLIDKKGTS